MKRMIDVSLAVAGLVIGAPLMALIALVVRLDSPGRVIFSQPRLGQHGRVFNVHKFRKFPDSWGNAGPGVTVAGDARMTRLGHFLERSKLDELPQLWNILRGEMSFVGPRPESTRYADLFIGELARVHDFKPGIFGPNQVAFRNESEMYPPERNPEEFYRNELFPQKAKADIDYFSQANILTDIAWIALGLWISIVGTLNWGRLMDMHGPIVAMDLLAIELAWLCANLIRFDGVPPSQHMAVYLTGIWLLPLLLIPVMMLAGCYRQPVRHFSAGDAMRLTGASIVGWAIAYLVLLGLFHRGGSILLAPVSLLLALPMMGFPRFWRREQWRRQGDGNGAPGVAIVIYGAGRRGSALAALFDQGFPNANVVGFLDDNDTEMRGRVIMGRKVLGSERDLCTIQAVHRIDQLWLTFDPDVHKHRRLRRWGDENGVKLVVLPVTQPFTPLCYREQAPESTATANAGLASHPTATVQNATTT